MTKRYAHLGEERLRQTSGAIARLMTHAKDAATHSITTKAD